jgi:hypothetical protein
LEGLLVQFAAAFRAEFAGGAKLQATIRAEFLGLRLALFIDASDGRSVYDGILDLDLAAYLGTTDDIPKVQFFNFYSGIGGNHLPEPFRLKFDSSGYEIHKFVVY